MSYDAFISYSHAADGMLSSKLQLALHRVAKPWYKIRALSIYRDQTNLSVTPDLWHTIQDALALSKFLVLMASPHAAKSKWVNKEIDYWLQNKSIETIIIVITDGELIWDNEQSKFLVNDKSPIPARLAERYSYEPLYVDLREVKSSIDLSLNNPIFKTQILPMAARLHNKSVIDLVSDEVTEHKKTVLLRNSAIGTLSGLLIAAVSLAVFATRQRNIANRERDIAVSRELTLLAEKNIKADPQLCLILAYEAAQKSMKINGKLAEDVKSILVRAIKANYKRIPLLFGEMDITGGGVESFAISPDETKIAVGSQGNEVKVVDANTFKILYTLQQQWTVSIKWSSDGKYIATSGQQDYSARIWDAENGKLIKEMKFNDIGGIMSVDWRVNTHQLAFALAIGDRSKVKVYDLVSDSVLFEVPGIRGFWSNDGTKLATGGVNDTSWSMAIYDQAGKFICSQPGHTRYVSDIGWSPGDKQLATVSVDDQVIIWNAETCSKEKVIGESFPLSVSWSPDKKFIAIGGGNGAVKIYDAINGFNLIDSIDYTTTLTGDRIDEGSIQGYVLDVAWSKDGKYLMLGDRGGSISFIDSRLFNNRSDDILLEVTKSLIKRELSKQERDQYLLSG